MVIGIIGKLLSSRGAALACCIKNRLRASLSKTCHTFLPAGVISPTRAVKGGLHPQSLPWMLGFLTKKGKLKALPLTADRY
jgi:hypothetical protein